MSGWEILLTCICFFFAGIYLGLTLANRKLQRILDENGVKIVKVES